MKHLSSIQLPRIHLLVTVYTYIVTQHMHTDKICFNIYFYKYAYAISLHNCKYSFHAQIWNIERLIVCLFTVELSYNNLSCATP